MRFMINEELDKIEREEAEIKSRVDLSKDEKNNLICELWKKVKGACSALLHDRINLL